MLVLVVVGHEHVGGQEQSGDAGGILQRHAGDLGRVENAGFEHVYVLILTGFVAERAASRQYLVHHPAAVGAGVLGDLSPGDLARLGGDVVTDPLIPLGPLARARPPLSLLATFAAPRPAPQACRARAGAPRVVVTSSVAAFGGGAMPATVTDTTKQTPETTYGMTKSIGELMINDYTRKGFLDGRAARPPAVIIRPGRPNAAASSFASGIFREPLNGEECVLPVAPETLVHVLGQRNCVAGLIVLHEADGAALGDDRAVNLPSATYAVSDMIEALKRVAAANGRALGPITVRPDAAVERIIAGWPTWTEADRALALGCPADESLDRVIQDYIDDFLGG